MFELTRALTGLCYNVDDNLLAEAKNQLKMSVLSQLDGSTVLCEDIGRQVKQRTRTSTLPPCHPCPAAYPCPCHSYMLCTSSHHLTES
jgi:hypothetical protein